MGWLKSHGKAWNGVSAPDSMRGVLLEACAHAGLEGRLEVLLWMLAYGCEWDTRTRKKARTG